MVYPHIPLGSVSAATHISPRTVLERGLRTSKGQGLLSYLPHLSPKPIRRGVSWHMMSVGDGAPAWSPVLFVTDVYSGDIANLKSGSHDDSRAGQHSGCVTTWYVCVNHYCYFVVNLCIRKPVFILFCLYLFSNGHKCQAGRPGNRKCSMPARRGPCLHTM